MKSIADSQEYPERKNISASYAERANLTMRMSMRTTNAHSKKIENHVHAIFARIHQTLRITPAKAANVSDYVWSIEEIIGLLN